MKMPIDKIPELLSYDVLINTQHYYSCKNVRYCFYKHINAAQKSDRDIWLWKGDTFIFEYSLWRLQHLE